MTEIRRVRPKEFWTRLGFKTSRALYNRIKDKRINPPFKDGGTAYWHSDYVDHIVRSTTQQPHS